MLQFGNLLVDNGIDAELDLWHDHDPQIDWTRWGPARVADSDFVIIVISRAWKQRWEGSNHPRQGAGAVVEANTLKGRFNNDQEDFQKRTLVVLLPGSEEKDIPLELHHLYRLKVNEISFAGIDGILRTLFGSPLHEKPPLGSQPTFSKATHSEAAPSPLPQDVASKRAELDAGDRNTVATATVHFEKPSAPPRREPTNAELLSNKLDHLVLAQVFELWDQETALFKEVSVEPTRELVAKALNRARQAKLISIFGPRIPIFDTEYVARFDLDKLGDDGAIPLYIESESGDILAEVQWQENLSTVDLLAVVSQRIFEQPYFQGALGFFPSSIFSGLSELLVLASEGRKGWGMGARHAFSKLIQVVDDYWVITEDRIFPKDRPWYTIAMSRIDELDWADHIKGKRWNGESGIDSALQLARKFAGKSTGA